jgi:hypothetical protein
VPLGDCSHHPRDLRAVERRERDDDVMRACRPRRLKFRPGRRDDQKPRLRSAFGEHLQQIERSRVRPM